MSFRHPDKPIVYPDERGNPGAMLYRFMFTVQEPWLAIIRLHQDDDACTSPVVSASVRDQVLNRVLDDGALAGDHPSSPGR
ncbi:hypothetical protein P5W99_36305 [Paraburkholderia sp. A3BS-1L]|uniref:hypothetical protein n=1 Tax=Paraburkholderia sp. A3BS-1L TaxID=3028375 RepID=UPI003DAA29BE